MDSWWSLGEGGGQHGKELSLGLITCPFCQERGNFDTVGHFEKKKPNGSKVLNFDTLKCGACASFVMVLWSAAEHQGSFSVHDFRVLPWSLRLDKYPEHWPEQIGRYWLQAKRNLRDESWDAANLMARSALQLALRNKGAEGANLKQEIANLAQQGILPPIMEEWSENIRELGNISAHPIPGQPSTNPQDVRDIVKFLDFLLEYLYTLPHQIDEYRKRREAETTDT